MLSEVIYFSGLFCLSFQASEHEETNVPLELDALVPISLPFTSVIDVELKDGAELLLKGFAKDRFERYYI
ncbi:hypothetical protein AB6A40_011700 [Gnathostoma spinigerum]|uniref:Uncharacterized protein n=1 Tax=Gnathostoma spinigerum TaxID=75299 RepID=A0ABD6EZT6_9BILA